MMKVEAGRLSAALSMASKFTRAGPVDLMECVLLTPGDGSLRVEASSPDGDIAIGIPAECSSAPAVAVSLSRLVAIISRSSDGVVSMSPRGDELAVAAPGSRGKLKTIEPSAFQRQSVDVGVACIGPRTLPLASAFQATRWAAQEKMPQPLFAGMSIYAEGDDLVVMCACPAAAVSMRFAAPGDGGGHMATLSIRSAGLVAGALAGQVTVTIGPRRAVFRGGAEGQDITITTPILSLSPGGPPKLPEPVLVTRATVPTKQLAAAISGCAAILGGSKFQGVRLSGGLSEDLKPVISVAADGPHGNAEMEVEIEGGGEEVEFSMPAKLDQLLRAVSSCPGPSIEIAAQDDTRRKPFVLSNGPWRALVMALKE